MTDDPRDAAGASSVGTPPPTPELDLTPREVGTGRRRRWPAYLVVVLLICAVGVLVVKMLDEATVFFYTADEAVERRDELGDDRFRLQGSVVPGSVEKDATTLTFTVVFDGVTVDVVHTGPEPDLFSEGVPVVLEGRWAGEVFESDEILVKHDEVYVEEHEDRLREADTQVDPSEADDR